MHGQVRALTTVFCLIFPKTGDEQLFDSMEELGHIAFDLHDKPDAGLWELRGAKRVHTFSSLMCWVACDRLVRT